MYRYIYLFMTFPRPSFFTVQRKPCRRAGFSLVEILSVVAILALLMSVATPALLSSSRASHLTQAGNRLVDMITLARQNAASKITITAVILAAKTSPTSRQGVTLLEYDAANQQWKHASGWIRLHEAVEATNDIPNANPASSMASVSLKLDGQTLSDYSDIVFFPDGRIFYPGDNPSLKVKLVQEGGSSANSYDIVFNKENSAFRVQRP